MRPSRRDSRPSFRNYIDLVTVRAPSAGKEWVRARTGSRDAERTDLRRDPAYHNKMLFAGSQR